MLKYKNLYQKISSLFQYPDEGFRSHVEELWLEVQRQFPEEVESVRRFRNFVNETSLTEIQEYYTRTFDINPIATLDISYHIFGDTYKRGQFLANLRAEQMKLGMAIRQELPDHLPEILHYLVKVKDSELRYSLANLILLPALSEIQKALDKSLNVYAVMVAFLKKLLMEDFQITKIQPTYMSKEKLTTLEGE